MLKEQNSIIDISWPIKPTMTTYKNKGGIAFSPTKTFIADGTREAQVTLPTHLGTHVDAPSHFLEHGSSIDQINLSTLIGPCIILDLTNEAESITREKLAVHDIKGYTRVLLKTNNSAFNDDAPFTPSFVYLHESGAQYLIDNGIITIGIDYLGIERNQPAHETHIKLLSNSITIIEGLRLAHVFAGPSFLCCLPLTLTGLDAAPARAVLVDGMR